MAKTSGGVWRNAGTRPPTFLGTGTPVGQFDPGRHGHLNPASTISPGGGAFVAVDPPRVQPAVTGATAGSNTITTASFTAPIGSMIVVFSSFDMNPASSTVTITDSLGGSWASVVRKDGTTAPAGNLGIAIFNQTSASNSARTVTMTTPVNPVTFWIGLKVYVIQPQNGGVITVAQTNTGGQSGAGTLGPVTAFTNTQPGSLLMLGAVSFNNVGQPPQPVGAGLSTNYLVNVALDDLMSFAGWKVLDTESGLAARSVSVTTNGGSLWQWVSLEIYEAAPSADIRNDTGTGSFGLAATATAVKVVTASARASLGVSSLAAARKVQGVAATASAGLASAGAGRKVQGVAATASAGLAGVATARKVAPEAATGSLGLAGVTTAKKVGRPLTAGSLGLAGVSTSKKVSRPLTAGSLGLAGVTSARKVAPGTGTGALGLAGVTTARKVSRPSAPGPVGLTSSSSAQKVSTPFAFGSFGLSATGADVKIFTGSSALGLAAYATARKVALPAASSAVGLSGTSSARKVALDSARASLGASALATARKVGTPSARGVLGLAGVSARRGSGRRPAGWRPWA
jgi:hypothetical protein